MDYRILQKGILSIILIILSFISCTEKEENSISNTYYIEMINIKDSLKADISKNIFGKTSYYKNNKIQIVSLNYVTEDYPDMHYFKNIEEIGKEIKPGSKKIRVEFIGNYSPDSIKYSLQKYTYKNNEWVKISDLGILKGISSYKGSNDYIIKEFRKQVITNIVSYTY